MGQPGQVERRSVPPTQHPVTPGDGTAKTPGQFPASAASTPPIAAADTNARIETLAEESIFNLELRVDNCGCQKMQDEDLYSDEASKTRWK